LRKEGCIKRLARKNNFLTERDKAGR
jgi:hypothetical protein